MAAGMGFGANTLLSGIQETFGDRMSSGTNFMLGAAKFGATMGAGVFTATHLGRAGLVAKAKFSSKNPLMQKAYAPMMKSGGRDAAYRTEPWRFRVERGPTATWLEVLLAKRF